MVWTQRGLVPNRRQRGGRASETRPDPIPKSKNSISHANPEPKPSKLDGRRRWARGSGTYAGVGCRMLGRGSRAAGDVSPVTTSAICRSALSNDISRSLPSTFLSETRKSRTQGVKVLLVQAANYLISHQRLPCSASRTAEKAGREVLRPCKAPITFTTLNSLDLASSHQSPSRRDADHSTLARLFPALHLHWSSGHAPLLFLLLLTLPTVGSPHGIIIINCSTSSFESSHPRRHPAARAIAAVQPQNPHPSDLKSTSTRVSS
nr:hypothetical protein CFP56_10130 [Quercus suber]